MRTGKIVDRNATAEIRKAMTREGVSYFVWKKDDLRVYAFRALSAARSAAGITCEPRKAAA